MKRAFASLLLLALAPFAIAQTAPATLPADLDSPKGAVKAFLSAKDELALRAAVAPAPAGSPDVSPFLNVMAASIRLQRAAEKQFGTSAAQYFSKQTDAQLTARLAQVEAAQVLTQGNTATLTLPANATHQLSESAVVVRKTAEGWKVDAASLFRIADLPKDQLARQSDVARTLTAITDRTATEINDRKFGSATDAYNEYWARSAAAIKKLESPATQPAK